jgi:DNA-binding NtrC family response regulator
LYHTYRDRLHETVQERTTKVPYWREFAGDCEGLLGGFHQSGSRPAEMAAHLLACFYQLRRAFEHIFEFFFGNSMPAAELRANVWQSIFTHDLGRYRRTLYGRMNEIATLVMGPSGTGKELVARAIALSQYIPFDPQRQQFTEDFTDAFQPVNLSELTPELIGSELFGHRKGAFTGADRNHKGLLEQCGSWQTVFLDEIGDLDHSLQVKLLRTLEYRRFRRVGGTRMREFKGKIVAATNRDLTVEMRDGRFRQDLYYRLCSDVIFTPSLRDQISQSDDELRKFVRYIAARVVAGHDEKASAAGNEADKLTDEVLEHIRESDTLRGDYAWLGNIRELEQCVRNVMIRKSYWACRVTDAAAQDAHSARRLLHEALALGPTWGLTADQLTTEYCRVVFEQKHEFKQTASVLGLDWRTVKERVGAGEDTNSPRIPRKAK